MAKRDRTGITVIHQRGCPVTGWEKCKCRVAYRAQVRDPITGRTGYKTMPTEAAARNWRHDRLVALRAGTERVLQGVVLEDLVADWFEEAEAGVIRARGGVTYKPSVLRAYANSWALYLEPRFGRAKVGEIRPTHVQKMVDELVAKGLAAQTVKNAVTPLRVFMRYAIRRELAAVNPCANLELPSGETVRDRIAAPSEAVALLTAIPDPIDRAIWATAFFTGMRRGELMGLRWENVDLFGREVHVVQAYDPRAREFIATKNRRRRTVGVPQLLIPYLAALDGMEGLVFPGRRFPGQPFADGALVERATAAWKDAGLEPIGLHECRHTFASVMIAANVNIKAISEMVGHSSVQITWDRYGHLMPGATAAATGLLDAYLEKELS